MRSRDIIIITVCIVIAGCLFILSGSHLGMINSQREAMNLVSNAPLENAPPELAFATVAMGAFRGLVVDILWMRAEQLKEAGQFFDAKQLAEWITTLQPRFPTVWDFQSWNMAYNISVAIPAEQAAERWRWVKNGYELLRDRAIKINPHSILLYRQLAFIFQHKIGGVSDDAHKYYKLQLAKAMEPLVAPADEAHYKALARVTTSWQQITSDANEFVDVLRAADSRFGRKAESFVSNYLSLRQNPARFTPEASQVMDRFTGRAALKEFDIFAKAYELRHTWKLAPVLMDELNRMYGPSDWNDPNKHLPLDWRHPDVHAIYWAVKGLRVAGKKGTHKKGEGQYSIDEINTDRMVNHSLQDLFRNGKIYIYDIPVTEPNAEGDLASMQYGIYLRPDLRMFEPYNKHLLKIINKYTDPNGQSLNSHQIGHRNMLKNAVLLFYQAGHVAQARRIYSELRRLYPSAEVEVPLGVFARKYFLEEMKSLTVTDAKGIIQMLLQESFFRYAMHDDDEAAGRENIAKEVYTFYNSSYGESIRVPLPKLPRMRYLALRDFLFAQEYPESLRKSLLTRISVERPALYKTLKAEAEKMQQEYREKLKKSSEGPLR